MPFNMRSHPLCYHTWWMWIIIAQMTLSVHKALMFWFRVLSIMSSYFNVVEIGLYYFFNHWQFHILPIDSERIFLEVELVVLLIYILKSYFELLNYSTIYVDTYCLFLKILSPFSLIELRFVSMFIYLWNTVLILVFLKWDWISLDSAVEYLLSFTFWLVGVFNHFP